MVVSYQLSSQDVKLTVDLLSGGVSNVTYTLLANETVIWIRNEGLGPSIGLQLTASRYLVTTTDYEFALVNSVAFLSCASDVGL